MKKLTSYLTLLLMVMVMVCLVSCNKPNPAPQEKQRFTAEEMAQSIQFEYENKDASFFINLDKEASRMLDDESETQKANITWSSDDSRVKVNGYVAELTYDAAKEDQPSTIKGTVEVDGKTASTDFEFRIVKVSTYDDYLKAPKGESLSMSGYISQLGEFSTKYKNFGLVIVTEDKEHSLYAHRTNATPELYASLKVGQRVGLTGKRAEYNGPQLEKANLVVFPTNDAFTETAVNLTCDMVKDDKTALPYLQRLVKAENLVIKSAFNTLDNSFEAELPSNVEGGSAVAVKLSLNKNLYEKGSPNQAAIVEALKNVKPGDTLTAEGSLTYNKGAIVNVLDPAKITVSSSNPDYAAVKISEANIKAALDKADFSKAGEVLLKAEEGVTATFTLNKTNPVLTLVDNKLTIAPTEAPVSFELTVSLTKGTESINFVEKIKVALPVPRPEVIKTTILPVEVTTNTKLQGKDNYAEMFKELDPTVWTVTVTNVLGPIDATTGKPKYENAPAINASNAVTSLRLYANKADGKGNSITFSQTVNEYQFVVLTLEKSKKGGEFTLEINGVMYDCPESGEVVVKLDKPSKDITIKNATTGSSPQSWISKIELA